MPPADTPPAYVQTLTYDPAQVVQLWGCVNFQTMVHILPDERIEAIAVGSSADWQVTPNRRGDLMSVKANTDHGTSNLTVVTNARSYHFDLIVASAQACERGEITYDLRFRAQP